MRVKPLYIWVQAANAAVVFRAGAEMQLSHKYSRAPDGLIRRRPARQNARARDWDLCSRHTWAASIGSAVWNQDLRLRCGTVRQRAPTLTAAALTDVSGTRAAAYQMCAFSSIRAVVFQPERQFRS